MSDTSTVPNGEALKPELARSLWPDDADDAFLLLDAAQSPKVLTGLLRFTSEIDVLSLYEGEAAVELAAVAPYLVPIPRGSALFSWFAREGWGRNWGCLLRSPARLASLRDHLRTLARVRTEDGRTLLFRYYDPRILRAFLSCADPEQVGAVFGPVECLVLEIEGGRAVEVLRHEQGLLRRETRTFGSA